VSFLRDEVRFFFFLSSSVGLGLITSVASSTNTLSMLMFVLAEVS
jgi:hypothetical protein